MTVNISDVRDEHSLRVPRPRPGLSSSTSPGQTSHLDSMTDPYTDLEINCRSQLSILEACRTRTRTCEIVFASTRQIYGRPEYLPVDETHPIAPVDVNGINKMAGEWYHLLYGEVYGIRTTALAADEHLRPAHAGEGRAPDVPRRLDPARTRGRRDPGLRRRRPDCATSTTSTTRSTRSCSPRLATRRAAASTTSAATATSRLLELAELVDSTQAAAARTARPVPARPQGDRHRRLLRRLLRDRNETRLVRRRSRLRDGARAHARLLPRARRALLGRTGERPVPRPARETARLRSGELDAASPAFSTAAGSSSARRSSGSKRAFAELLRRRPRGRRRLRHGRDHDRAAGRRRRRRRRGDHGGEHAASRRSSGIERAGAIPVLVDVDPVTLHARLRRRSHAAITPRTRAIVPVHLYGQMRRPEPLCSSSPSSHGLAVVEDCAQAHGAEVDGRRAGSIGRRGRVQLLSDQEPRRARRRRRGRRRTTRASPSGRGCCATTANASASSTCCAAATAGSTRCRQRFSPRSSRISTTGTARGARIAASYDAALPQRPGSSAPVEAPGRRHVYHLYVVETAERDAVSGRAPVARHRDRCPLPARDPSAAGLSESWAQAATCARANGSHVRW